VHRLGHAVEHLDLVAGVRDAAAARLLHRVGDRPEVVAPERGAYDVVVVVQEADAALEVGVGLRLVLEHGHRPALGSADDGLGVPVRALDQADGDRAAPRPRPRDEGLEVAVRVLQVRLDHDADLEVGELGLVEEVGEQFERQILDVVVLHVEVHEPAARARPAQQRS
jgi:hypothetical protein